MTWTGRKWHFLRHHVLRFSLNLTTSNIFSPVSGPVLYRCEFKRKRCLCKGVKPYLVIWAPYSMIGIHHSFALLTNLSTLATASFPGEEAVYYCIFLSILLFNIMQRPAYLELIHSRKAQCTEKFPPLSPCPSCQCACVSACLCVMA